VNGCGSGVCSVSKFGLWGCPAGRARICDELDRLNKLDSDKIAAHLSNQ
jgi:hypothetical protein